MQTLAVRVEDETATRIDALARQLGVLAAGANITRSECVRIAMERGLAAVAGSHHRDEARRHQVATVVLAGNG